LWINSKSYFAPQNHGIYHDIYHDISAERNTTFAERSTAFIGP
jgi:hypothetical protein